MTHSDSRTRVKICGLTTAADRDLAVTAGADAVGFISGVSVDTPREISAETAATLVETTPPFVSTVLVTMPDDVSDALERIDRVGPDAVQVHGLSPSAVAALAGETDAAVLAAVTAANSPDYESVADALVVDSLDDDGAGGTGETHDWERARDRVEALDSPVVLAGGLTPDNVGAAIETVAPYGVDVASGVERSSGHKDPAAVRSFLGRAGTRTDRPEPTDPTP
ncbi:phosphoribosylanthranilate isomerase [Halocatena pleomorpha]|uniref:N-(5'-phosphoribosyl)anthranilate isomerase n=1 Tax=Halocatena pleomorpha TaxID=1785090 RepID=A0A3P3R6H9_9EURY|nr:phosphoribosylanthranilate isomerase [Halocatena pleomorpha]RRJ28588.1 phosphoribosylanthranilate isomerase [Halocatena pleomorpha]